MRKSVSLALALTLFAWGARAGAEATGVEIKATAEVEVKIKGDDGNETVQRQPAKKVPPGGSVIYTLRAENKGSKPAADVVVTDPIPEHMDYVDGSASSDGAQVTFSTDGGKTFLAKEKLVVKTKDGTSRAALASELTHIRWRFEKPLAPGESRSVEFRARVE
ncbi:MAG TPA: hypothetical protein VMR86_11420 [Myxococcota bacterium]|nr:hypothetical protein [Myxococcota bacterium]